MAEIELNILNNQCLGRRIKDIETVKEEVTAWENVRNRIDKKIHWQFTCSDARVNCIEFIRHIIVNMTLVINNTYFYGTSGLGLSYLQIRLGTH